MATYLNLVNDAGHVIIDDDFQNYHLIKVETVNGATMGRYSTGYGGLPLEDSNGFNMVQHVFKVNTMKKPVVAYKIGKNLDAALLAVTYTETSPNNWDVKVMCPAYTNGSPGTYGTLTLYVFGLIPLNTTPTKGAVFQVTNALGEMVFDSGRLPMNVVQFNSKLVPYAWLYPSLSTQVEIPVVNWSPDKTYAIVPCSFMFDSYYSNPNFFYYTGTFAKMYDNTQGKIILGSSMVGVNNIMWAQNYPSMVSYSHAMIVIDVTGY